MQQGWECPKCGSVYSPSMVMCLTCPGQVFTSGSTIHICEFDEGVTMPACKTCGQPKQTDWEVTSTVFENGDGFEYSINLEPYVPGEPILITRMLGV